MIHKRISFQFARHTFGTITLLLSRDIASCKNQLGHKKIEATQLYAKVLDNQKQSAKKWKTI